MRHEFLLDKEWRFLLGDGLVEAQKTHSDSYNSSKSGQERGIPNMSFDDSDWRIVDVPHDYLTETDFSKDNLISHGYKTRCNAWYRKSFKLPAEFEGKHIFMSFEGLSVTARVYLNGSLMGRSFSAYAPLDIEITDRAFFGDRVNTVVVYIDGLSTEGWWYEGAGIYRHVKLFVKEPLHIAHDGIFIKPVFIENTANDWAVVCEATVENSAYESAEYKLRTEIYDGDELVVSGESEYGVCDADAKSIKSHTLHIKNPTRWDVISPKLYTAKVSLIKDGEVIDTDSTKIGFRTFTVDKDKGFFLNGRPIKLMGTCNHQDHAGVGVAVPDSVQYYRIRRLKEMGTNAYRCSHNMPTKAVLDACDELGMLVMDENRRFESRPEVLAHVEAMVRRDRNHPSVVMYSLFNEEPIQGTKEGGNIFRKMRSVVDRLDDSRMLTGAMNGGFNDPKSAAIYMDVTGINYALPNGVEEYHKLYPNQPVVGSENNSAISTRGCYKTSKEDHTLSCYDEEVVPWGQLIKTTWKFTRENDWFGGIFIWTGFDYRGEPTPYEWPSIGSQFGIMDTCGFAKDSFWQNKVCFDPVPMMHICPHWNWTEGETVRVMTVTNCEEVELFLNGESLGRRKSDVCDLCIWDVKYVPGKISAIGYNEGVAVAQAENVTAGAPKKIVIEPDRTYLNNDGMDAIPVNFSVVDENGVTVETANNLLHFEIDDDAILLGVGNGDPNGLESDHEPQRSLFAGHAQALIQSKVGAKKIKIKAYSDGLESAEVELEVREVEQPKYIYAALNRDIIGFTASSAVYDEEPNALIEIADNDMNSLEPIGFNQWHINPGHKNGWKLLRAIINIPKLQDPNASGECELKIKELYAEQIKIYVGGKLICEASAPENGKPLCVPFIPEASGKQELRMIIKAVDGSPCGIKYGVSLSLK
ncbi:MAG: glycoside hydrolase family 2 protein [Clostridiales bacterium]|nr:glycoside hydrolase family 2 protein [Clostridiales bacterium]